MGLVEQLTTSRDTSLEPIERMAIVGSRARRSIGSAQDLETLFGEQASCIQLTSGRFGGVSQTASTGDTNVVTFSAQCGLQVRTEIAADRVAIATVSAPRGTRVVANGYVVSASDAVVVSGGDLLFVALGAAEVTCVIVPAPAGIAGPAAGVVSIDATERQKFGEFARDVLRAEPGIETAGIAAIAAQLYARAQSVRPSLAHARRMTLFRKAQEHLWKGIAEPQHIDALCAVLSCNVRTLFYAFKTVVGMSPMKYFKIQRLNAAHRRLRAGSEMPIFCVAADCGFWHMGHFGADFKALFGFNASNSRMHRGTIPSSVNDDTPSAIEVSAKCF